MALNISFFDPDVEDEDERYRGAPELSRDQFGFYSWRGVWGSAEILNRGGGYLSTLKTGDLHVLPSELEMFQNELEKICNESQEISAILKVEYKDMQCRLKNAISACEEAFEKGFGVCID